jgi:hypothetical protein
MKGGDSGDWKELGGEEPVWPEGPEWFEGRTNRQPSGETSCESPPTTWPCGKIVQQSAFGASMLYHEQQLKSLD